MESEHESYPLTNPQKVIWYTEKLHPGTSMNVIAGTLRIKEKVEPALLEKAINLLIEKNDAMRLRITDVDGEPRQYFPEYEYKKIDYFDLSAGGVEELYKWDAAQTRTPLELIDSDLYYFAVVKVGDGDTGVYFKCHHLVADAWSVSLLGNQLMSHYSALKKGIAIPSGNNPSYKDYIAGEQDYMKSDRFEKDADYWNKAFGTFPGRTVLKEGSPDGASIKARRKTMIAPGKLSAKINRFCAENKTSAFSLFIAAIAMYINRISAKEDIIIGTTTLNRANLKEKSTIGLFAGTAPMRIRINDGMNFATLIENVTAEGFRMLRHQKYPHDLLLKEIRGKYKIYGSLFDIVLNYQNSRFIKDEFEERYSTRWHFNGYQADSLHININDREGEGRLIIDYDYKTGLFCAKEIEFIHQHIINILWHALDNPSKEISRLEMLSEREKRRILEEFNTTRIIFPGGCGRDKRAGKIPAKAKSYILDRNLNLVPIGIPGDMHLSGAGLAPRKLKSIGLSEADAAPNPFVPGDLLYKVGIRARWFPDGDIMYIGGAKRSNAGTGAESGAEPGAESGAEPAGHGTEPAENDKMPAINANIAATFTAEPVGEYVVWWGARFGYDIRVKFADYNQVFQELLNPESMMAENTNGINIFLARPEDFCGSGAEPEEMKVAALEKTFRDFMEALEKFGSNIPMIVAIFPASGIPGRDPDREALLRRKISGINEELAKMISRQKNVFALDFSDLHIRYGIGEAYDPLKDREAHMPFTDEYYAAMGTEIARKILAIKRQDFKVIVLDCDNTLWKGVCGELGPLGVQVTAPYLKLQQFMLRKYNEGMLLAICSKNNRSDVVEVFGKNPGMLLKQDHFASIKANWEEKCANIRAIAGELGIGADSFIFVDDDPLECSKMAESCPEALTLRLPDDESLIPAFLDHAWAFDKVRVTSEDALRNRMYHEEMKRKAMKSGGISLESFLEGLELKVSMRLMSENEIERAAQLTQRTNQFNLSTTRRSREEMAELAKDEKTACLVVEASDKFGDYGIIGLVILRDENGVLFMDTFLMSCRIFGRNVEDAMLAGIRKYAEETGKRRIEAVYVQTEKNRPVYDFIRRTKWKSVSKSGKQARYSMDAADLPKSVGHMEFHYMKAYKKPETASEPACEPGMGHVFTGGGETAAADVPAQSADAAGTSLPEAGIAQREAEPGFSGADIEFDTSIMARNTKHIKYIEPFNYPTGRKLAQIFAFRGDGRNRGTGQFENETREKLSAIVKSVLKTDNFGPDSDFFEIGADSLHAVILISRIGREFGTELTLMDIFRFNTIGKLARKIEESEKGECGRIEPAVAKPHYEVSSAQKRMFILNMIEPDRTAYNECHMIRIKGRLDRARLENAFREFIRRHEIMRTGFEMSEDGPVQKVRESVEFGISYARAREKDLDRLAGEFIKPFDLSEPPLMRVCLVETGKEKYALFIDVHHIITDGASFGIMINEIQALYAGREPDPPRLQYKDFAIWQNKLFKTPQMSGQEQFWLGQFSDGIPALDMPSGHPRPPYRSFNGKKLFFTTDPDFTGRLKSTCSGSGTTMFMLLFAAFGVLLHRYAGQEDFVVGIPASGRRHADTRNIAGMFVNMLPIRTRPRGESTFAEYLAEVKNSILAALENQDYPYERLLEKLNVPRELNRNPLFDVMFSLRNTDMPELGIPGLALEHYAVDNHKTKFDLSLLVSENAGALEFCLEYCVDLFGDDYMARFRGHFLNILREIAQNPQKRISEIEIMGEREKHGIIYGFNNTAAEYPRDKTIHRLFEEQAERTPDRVAVIFMDRTLTYAELNSKANRLARTLRDKGVAPDTIVAIMAERSLEMITGILAILKAGGAYLPIDPDYPWERIRYMLEDSGAKILLTQRKLAGRAECLKIPVIELWPDSSGGDAGNLHDVNRSSDLAYVIYTSGSTGKPKGVMIEHHSVINRLYWMQKEYPINENSVILQKTPYTFDVSVWELFWWSFFGAGMCFLEPGKEKDPEAIIKAVEMHGVTTVHFVPSMLGVFLEYVKLHDCTGRITTLKQVFSSGEALSPRQVELFNNLIYSRNRTVLINLYGPTEATVDVSHYNCSTGKKLNTVPIGKPIDNIRLYILDRWNNVLPAGIPGELHIGGVGLARGYINNDKLTGEKFIPNPHSPGELMYKTGDLAKWDGEGNVEYLGRLDFQVKIRGFRIEPGEIEKTILKYGGVKEAIVTLEKGYEDNYLCAYLVGEKEMDIAGLKMFLLKHLPGYMMPAKFAMLREVPLLPNGKIDRKKLAAAAENQPGQKSRQKLTGKLQEYLGEIFKKLLDIREVGPDDSFFEIGGDSINTIKLSMEIYNLFEVNIGYADILKNPTIASLGRLISGRLVNGYRNDFDLGHPYMLLNGKKDRNIFAFPPITGFGLAFNNMSKYIYNYSLYAFDYIPEDNKISRYISLITEIQPEGPYVLLGFSAGAYIALEISKLLRDESVLILIDGFFGEITKNEINDKVNFFVNYSKEYINLASGNKFVNSYLESHIKDYMHYVADMDIYASNTSSDVHYLQSDEMPEWQMEKIKKITNGSFYNYRVRGGHFDLLKDESSMAISRLVESILGNRPDSGGTAVARQEYR